MELEANFNTWTIIFLIAAAHGIFLSIIILAKGRKANYFLGALIGLFAISLVYYVAFWVGISPQLPRVFWLTLRLPLLFGPILYFYFKILLKLKITKADHLQWIPFVLAIVIFSSFYITGVESQYGRFLIQARVLQGINVFQNLHLLFYSTHLIWLVQIHHNKLKQSLLLKKIAWFFTGFSLSYLSYYVLVYAQLLQTEYDYMISAAMSVFIYFIGYSGYQYPALITAFENGNGQHKYQRSGLTQAAIESLGNKILKYMEQEKPYVNSELKMNDLADSLDISGHHLSQVINGKFNQNFSDFINTYRINTARKLLADPANRDEKIINIAYDSGFNNKVTFNNTFRKHTGMSPTSYRNRQRAASKVPVVK